MHNKQNSTRLFGFSQRYEEKLGIAHNLAESEVKKSQSAKPKHQLLKQLRQDMKPISDA